MTDQITLGEMFAERRDRMKTIARRIARDRGGSEEEADTMIDGIADRLLERPVRGTLDEALEWLTTAMILDFMGQTDWPED